MTQSHNDVSTQPDETEDGVSIPTCLSSRRPGPSYGNRACFLRTRLDGTLDHVYGAASGRWFHGSARLVARSGGRAFRTMHRLVEPAGLTTESVSGDLRSVTRVFVDPWDAARAWIWCCVRNQGAEPSIVHWYAEGALTARPSKMHRKQAPEIDRWQAVDFVKDSGDETLMAYAGCGEHLTVRASAAPAPSPAARDRWTWRDSATVLPGACVDAWVCMSIGEEGLRTTASDAWEASVQRAARWGQAIRIPGAPRAVQDGVYWGMVNSDRVLHRFRHGFGFTNDPPGSIIVTRDVAWFTFGADWFAPGAVREMLDTLIRVAPYPSGKIAEYIDLNEAVPVRHDYGLDIADPTPLLLLAVAHHAFATGDTAWLRGVFPEVKAATGYLISQIRDGLVICDSDANTPGSGQCGWRNILDGIRITGVVTELQAESVAALRQASEMAEAVGDAAASDWRTAASRLEVALAERLVERASGRFRLALDPRLSASRYGADDTIDQVFPAIFCPGASGAVERSARRVLDADYRAAWGLRTAPVTDPHSHPRAQVGLIGGTWPNACAWAAAAAAPFYPAAAAGLAEEIGRTVRPGGCWEAGAWVPGQFAEWFDGATGEALGMTLSPWMPPTYVWLLVERLMGIRAGATGLSVRPHVPDDWIPFAALGLRYGDGTVDVVVDADAVYIAGASAESDRPVVAVSTITLGEEDRCQRIRATDTEGRVLREWEMTR